MALKSFVLRFKNATEQRCSGSDSCTFVRWFCSNSCLFCPCLHLLFVPSITGNYIPDHRWLYLLIGFSETLEAAEVTNLILSHLIRAFFLKSLFYFVLFYFSKQKNFFLVGTADGTLAVFEDRAVKVDLFFLVCSKNAASNM